MFVNLLLTKLFVSFSLSAQKNHQVDVTKVRTDVLRGHLDFVGRNLNSASLVYIFLTGKTRNKMDSKHKVVQVHFKRSIRKI